MIPLILLTAIVAAEADPLVINPSLDPGYECTLFLRDNSGNIVHSSGADCDYVPEHPDGECTLTIESNRSELLYRALSKCPEGDD